ncbi:Remorin, C-terminal [Dillenia turbinata]|uniref:Remorin, C-terminal n=1 Tax=Dillenia turbinata TaxID=194707 RepID=A0AAN8V465_9MAGN
MRSIEDKRCLSYGPTQEISTSSSMSFEFHNGGKGTNRSSHHRTALGKPTPSKWDDAQKWLVGFSRGEKNQNKTTPRNSNAEDRRLIAPVPKRETDSSEDEAEEIPAGFAAINQCQVETKNVDCKESIWRINKSGGDLTSGIRSIYVRDMGTEMTPIASQEPSRTATPIRAATPVRRSPISSGASTPMRCQNGLQEIDDRQVGQSPVESRAKSVPSVRGGNGARRCSHDGEESNSSNMPEHTNPEQDKKMNPLETRAMAWDEAERAKYMARYKREEVKIQAWENHEKRKAEMESKRMEVKAERMKSRAQEKLANKLAVTRRIAEEKRANAEAKLNEKAVRISERADYIRRTGHLPSSFSFKLPSFCWQ